MGETTIKRYQHTFTLGYNEKGKELQRRLNALKTTLKAASVDAVLREAIALLEQKVGKRKAA